MSMVMSTPKQTFIGIWFHDNNLTNDQKDKMKSCLNRKFDYYRVFARMEDFIKYVSGKSLVAEVFLIISHFKLYSSLIELAKTRRATFPKIYAYLPTEVPVTYCFITSSINILFEELSKDILEYISGKNLSNIAPNKYYVESDHETTSHSNRILPSINVFKPELKQSTPIKHLTKESLNLLCFITMTGVLLRFSSYEDEDLLDMWTTCRDLHKEKKAQLDHIEKLKRSYRPCDAVRYYTENSCLSRIVNQTCHTENMQHMYALRVYINDLHKKLTEIHKEQEEDGTKLAIEMVYRGTLLSGSVLQQLIDNEGGLISMNGFLSATVACHVAIEFTGDMTQISEGHKSVLFLLEIDGTIRQPYAYIPSCSAIQDEIKVLFSLGTIWRIKSVTHNTNPCEVVLTSCDELDSQSIELLKKYTEDGYNLSSVGDILHELGNSDEAEWFYKKMLKQDSLDSNTRGNLYNKIGNIRSRKEEHTVALKNFKKAASLFSSSINQIDQIRLPQPLYMCDNHPPLIAIYNNMGLIHEKNGEFKEAVHCYQQGVEVKNGSKVETATVHNNLGLLYCRRGDYKEAREHHMKATKLIDESHSKWIEFKKNLDCTDQRCEHLANKKQNVQTERTTIDELTNSIFHLFYKIFIIIALIVFASIISLTLL
jgi:tetratricopeptide (TPR) repeat protein